MREPPRMDLEGIEADLQILQFQSPMLYHTLQLIEYGHVSRELAYASLIRALVVENGEVVKRCVGMLERQVVPPFFKA